jgi:hypothetical protein
MRLLALGLTAVSATVTAGLFGLKDLPTGDLSLVNIDPKTGKETIVGTVSGEVQAQALATIDDKNGIYYILGWDGKKPNIMGIDVITGLVVSKAEIDAFASEAFVGVGQGIDWEPDTGAIVAAGQDTTRSWSIGLVDPYSGNFDLKAYVNNSEGKYIPALASPSVYTTDQRDFVMLLGLMPPTPGIEFIAVNLDSGKVAQMPWCDYLETTDYDLQTKSIYGIGLTIDPHAPGGGVRTLVQVRSDASGCTIVGNVTGYFIIELGISAIDTEQRVLYFLSFPCVKQGDPGCSGRGAIDLVGVDLRTGKIVSAVSGYCMIGTCPWSLEFANPVKRLSKSS